MEKNTIIFFVSKLMIPFVGINLQWGPWHFEIEWQLPVADLTDRLWNDNRAGWYLLAVMYLNSDSKNQVLKNLRTE